MINRNISSGDRCLHVWLMRKQPSKEKTEEPFKGPGWNPKEHYMTVSMERRKRKFMITIKNSDSHSGPKP